MKQSERAYSTTSRRGVSSGVNRRVDRLAMMAGEDEPWFEEAKATVLMEVDELE